MGEIKSAFELALERTKGIQSDPHSLRRHEAHIEGKILFGRLLKDADFDIRQALKQVSKERQKWVNEGMLEAVINNIVLPKAESDGEKLKTVKIALAALLHNSSRVKSLVQSLEEYFQQYLSYRTNMIQELRQRFQPHVRQREREMQQQLGRRVQIDPSSLPEFAKALQDALMQLEAQYRAMITEAEAQLRQLFADMQS